MAARRLIINADDFGLTAGVNRAIVEAHRAGTVTSATLMANAGASAEALELAQAHPALSVGCHVTLLDGAPLLAAAELPWLADPATGKFRHSLRGFALAATSAAALASRARAPGLNPEEIRREAEAQIRRLQSAGLRVSHVDTHKHLHILPAVLEPLLAAARNCGVRAVRNPFPSPQAAMVALPPSTLIWGRRIALRALRVFARHFYRRLAEAGMTATGGNFGAVVTGAMTPEIFESIMRAVPDGTWELVCHPGYDDADLATISTRLRASRALELALLTSPRARAAVEQNGVELISYREL